MIFVENNMFHLATKHTSYLFGLREARYLEHYYYGSRLHGEINKEAMEEKFANGYGNTISTPENNNVTLDNLCLEYSYGGTGDFRSCPLEITMPDGSFSPRFSYAGYETYMGIFRESIQTGMPYGRDNTLYGNADGMEERTGTIETLCVKLEDRLFHVVVLLVYTVFPDCDVISRRTVIQNMGTDSITLHKVMSLQLDLPEADYEMETFDGSWARERQKHTKTLLPGKYINDSVTGSSSNRHNPFVMVNRVGCTEDQGECFGINLLYSGNHYEEVEVSPYEKIRIHTGINPFRFSWELGENEVFYAPEAIMTYTNKGKNDLSSKLHRFVKHHIVSPYWSDRERPILLNNWEATYFDFSRKKLDRLAKKAKDLGVELFVLDDGWFGNRNDDTTSLGDWEENQKKLGGSLKDLSDEIHTIGLDFGIWMEPEMISEKSSLFEAHPDWAVTIPEREAYIGRNQLVLDYTNSEVREYIINKIIGILKGASIQYVKWDMNRPMTDGFSKVSGARQGEFYHRYMLGLYEVIKEITETFPETLFESCSAGGNRFDLGMLFYMPQTWTSDDTDAHERITIQEGTSYGYPLQTMGAHVSAIPNHQTLRSIHLETRFQVACFGLLGYELDVNRLTRSEEKIIKRQIAFYKENRRLFQFGTFSRHRMHNGSVLWQVLNEERTEGMVMHYQAAGRPNTSSDILKVYGLMESQKYLLRSVPQSLSIKQFGSLINQVSPIAITDGGVMQSVVDKVYTLECEEEQYVIMGDQLESAGIKLKQQFVGTGYNQETRVMGDYSSRMYRIKAGE